MSLDWHTRRLDLPLSLELAQEMWRRAHQWDLAAGGRFEAYGTMILLWSSNFAAQKPVPVGAITVFWQGSDEKSATIHHIAWDTRRGSEEEVLRAIGVLAGVHQLTLPK